MAFAARRSLAAGLSRHLTRRLHPSLSHLVPSLHDRSEDPSSSSSAPPNPTQKPSPFPSSDLRRRPRSQNLTLPLPFGAHLAAHRNFSSGPEVDGVLSDAASSVGPALPASSEHSTDQERKMKLGELYKKHGVSRLTPYKLLFIQVPILLSFTCAIRNMIEKVPSLEGGGAYWFTDLTTPDQLYIFPVLASIAYAAAEINVNARLAGSPKLQKIRNFNRVFSVLIIPVSMSFCKAHFCYWVPWTLFSVASEFAFRQPAVMQYLDIPQVAPPRPAPAALEPASEGPKPIPSVDSPPPASNGSGPSSSEPIEKSVDVGKKRRTPRVITNRVQ